MPIDPVRNDISDMWQQQPVDPIKMSPDELRRKATRFQTRIRSRNLLEYAGALYVLVTFGFALFKAQDLLMRLGSVLIIAGVLYVVYHLHSRGSAKVVPSQMGLTPCMEFHRKELEKQRDLLRSVWSWYLAPLLPGLAIVTLTRALNSNRNSRIFAMVYSLAVAVFVYFIWKLNQRAAAKLQRQIDELDK